MAERAKELKDEGNAALNAGNYQEAIDRYTEAIELDSENHVLYSNRSAAYAKMEKYSEALKDGEKTISVKPDWVKGYSRKGAALAYLNRYPEAVATYEKGLTIDSNNQLLLDGLADCQKKMESRGNPDNLFNNPQMFKKLAEDPTTKEYLKDPLFMKNLQEITSNPQSLGNLMKDDPRMMTALSVMMGLDPSSISMADKMPEPPRKAPTPASKPKKEEKMEVDLTPEQQQALSEKEKGNAAYKKKDFENAILHYNKAIELDPINITYLNNKAAVFYEKKEFETCIETCQKAVEIGRENRADFKIIAKSLTRIGNAYKSLSDLDNAKTYYLKSLSEHRTPDTRELLSKVEKLIKEKERLASIDPEKAEEERQKGNECFRNGKYPDAIKHYTNAIYRNPEDAKIYSNRAACYTKLAEFNLGLKDCEECIKLDPNFLKGYIRKGKILQGLKQHVKAQAAYQKAIDIDGSCQEALDGFRQCMSAANNDPEEVRQRAMNDPEIIAILKDPAMRMIMEQMQNDPQAINNHLQNPDVASKIQKLMQCGIISLR